MNESLLKALNSEDESDRLYAIYDIIESEITDKSKYFIERLSIETSQAVRDALVTALKHTDNKSIFDQLFLLFESPDPYLRNAAVSIFAMGGEDALAYLTSKMDHSDREVRKLILDSLVEIGSADALIAIRAALYDPSKNVQIAAAEYLGKLRDKQSLEDLLNIFKNDEEPMLRAAILNTLREIGDRNVVGEIMNILCPSKNLSEADYVYFTELYNLVICLGDYEDIKSFIDNINYSTVYAKDIVDIIISASRKFPDIFKLDKVKYLINRIKSDENLEEEFKNLLEDKNGFNGNYN